MYNKKLGKRCIIYIRVSTEIQVKGYSIKGQERYLTEYAERMGLTVVKVYVDEGKSGKSIEGRDLFQAMLLDISTKNINTDYVVVFKLSRFGRNARDILNSLEYIMRYNVNLLCAEDGLDSSTQMGKMMITILGAVAEMERENIIAQTYLGRVQKALEGGWNGGFAPYGYQIESGKLVKNESQREAVETIFRLYLQGKVGYTGVTRYLNKNGYKREPAPNAVNPQFDDWNVHHVKRILINPIYTGRIAWGRRKTEKVEGTENEYKLVPQDEFIISDIVAHEPYISREEFEKVQEMMKIAAKRGNHNIGQTQAHLLSGIAKCPECGSSMYTSNSTWTNADGTKGVSYRYVCSHHLKSKGSTSCRANGISTERLDREVLEYTKRLLANKEFAEDLEEKVGHVMNMEEVDKEIEFNNERLKKAERKRANLERDIDNIDGEDKFAERKREDYNRRLNKIYEEIYELEDIVQELEGRRAGIESKKLNVDVIYELLEKFDKIYDKMDRKERREWVKSMIYEVGTYTREEINQHGYAAKYITYKFPIDSDVLVELRNKESHVETVVKLSLKKIPQK